MKKIHSLLIFIQVLAVLLAACGRKGPDAPPDTTPPAIMGMNPGPVNSRAVPPNSAISITFSEPVDENTITFTLGDGTSTIQYTMNYAGTTVIFTPNNALAYGTSYTALLSPGVRDLSGNAMPTGLIWQFTTATAPDTTPPSVLATTPSKGAIGVFPNAALSVTFSEPVNQSTITFTLSDGSNTILCTLSYAGTTAIFTPSTMLVYGTTYTATVSAGVQDLAGNLMPSDYNWTFTTGSAPDTSPPKVTANIPAVGGTNVGVNISPSVTFSEPVDQHTISFVLSVGNTTVPCTMSYSGTTAIFTPASPLSYNTLYTATVSAGVNDLAGNAMQNDYFWSFMTGIAPDTTPPAVSATTPADGATNVVSNAALSVTFSEPVNQSTITFTLSDGSNTIPCTLSYAGTTAIFTPSNVLAYGTTYTAKVSAGVMDLAGLAMAADHSWTFTTGAAPDTTPPNPTATAPAAGVINVGVNTAISLTFSEPVDQSTITFTLSGEGATVPCTVSYSGTTAIFTPSSNLAYNTLYTATVSAGVNDLAGNAMQNDYFWSFMTGAAPDTTPPTVTATTPADKATNVVPNAALSVTFSEPVDQTTITFTLSDGSNTMPCTLSYAGTTAIFTPSNVLAYGTTYTAKVSAGVMDLAGLAMAADHSWTFTTGTVQDTTPPTIVLPTSPADGDTVGINTPVIVTFSEPMNLNTINTQAFTLSDGNNNAVPGMVTYSGTTTAIFIPTALAPGVSYTATVSTGVKDLAGNSLAADYSWTFTTQ